MTHPEVLDEQNVLLRLDNLEVEQRRLDALVSGWAKGSVTDPYFDNISANTGTFWKSPIEGGQVTRITTQTMASGAFTAIQFTTQHLNNADYIVWSSVSGESSRIYIPTPGINEERGILVSAFVEWKTSTVGFRDLALKTYRSDGSSIGGIIDREVPYKDTNTGEAVSLLTFVYRPNSSHGYVQLEPFQNTGGDLGIIQARLALIRIF